MKTWQWLVLILVGAFVLRTWNVNWDSGYHFHPDERWIVMVTEKIKWVNPVMDWNVFNSVDSLVNPKFFAYGSLPIYLLKFVGESVSDLLSKPEYGVYLKINLVGRVLSALFDTGTVLLVYLFGKRFFNKRRTGSFPGGNSRSFLALWGAGFYAISVLPIQLSHFYAVDTILTFFITLTIYLSVRLIQKVEEQKVGRIKDLIFLGLAFGMAMATKVSAVVLIVPIVVGLLIGLRFKAQKKNLKLIIQKLLLPVMYSVLFVLLVTGIAFVVFEPYAVIDWQTFIKNIQEQGRMTRDAWTFPYTLQYVGTKSYLYFIEQYVRYGVGWALGWVSILGVMVSGWWLVWSGSTEKENRIDINRSTLLIVLSFVIVYFGIVGRFAVKFMRYMLPLYPLMSIFAVGGVVFFVSKFLSFKTSKLILSFVFLLTSLWTWGFMGSVYGQENTRITASRWMGENLRFISEDEPYGAGYNPAPAVRSQKFVLGIEHWDDALPVPPWNRDFKFVELPLYERDSGRKWRLMAQKLEEVNAIVLASNRLSAPLMRIGEYDSRYEKTKRYYELLFGGDLGFEEVADFYVKPKVLWWEVDTQLADESFQVYDHPRVRVFVKKEPKFSEKYFDLIMK